MKQRLQKVGDKMIQFVQAPVTEVLRVTSFVSLFQSRLDDTQIESVSEAHPFWEFLFLESGKLSVLVDGELYTLSPGELILYPPHSFHSIAASSDTVVKIASFTTESNLLYELSGRILSLGGALQEDLSRIVAFGKKILVGHQSDNDIRGMQLRDYVEPADTQRLSNLLELFLLDLFNTKARTSTQNFRDEQFATFNDFLKKHIKENLTLEEICDGCFTSATNLQKLCHKQCGCGPVTYFISLKIGAAKRMMKETSLNFTQIAESLGFSSVHYFSKLFKAKTGMSPSDYAKSVEKTR